MSNIVPRHLRYEQVTTEDQVIVRRAGVHCGRLLARTRWRLARYGDRVSILADEAVRTQAARTGRVIVCRRLPRAIICRRNFDLDQGCCKCPPW